jgi:hypothetical protein
VIPVDKIEESIEQALRIQRDAAAKANAEEENQVNIRPDGYIAKEIIYQTAVLHGIMREVNELKQELKKGQQKPPRKKLFVFNGKR